MDENNKIQVLPLAAPLDWWGLFINGICVKAFDNKGQAIGWACDPNLV